MEEEIIEYCPSCGCAVAGELPEKDQWKELGKGLLSTIIGGYFGGKYGDDNNAGDIAQNVAGGTYAMLSAGQKRQVFEFNCPRCGYSWRSHGLGDSPAPLPQVEYKQPNNTQEETDNQEIQLFNDEFNQFFDNEDTIISSKESLLSYYNKIDDFAKYNVRNTIVRSEYRFLQAFVCEEYLYYVHADDSYVPLKGIQAIDKAIQDYHDNEYIVLKQVLQSYNLHFESPDILSIQKNYDRDCPNIQSLQNTLIKTEYLEQIYNFSRFWSLLTTSEKLDEKGLYRQAIDALKLMLELDTPMAYITASSHLYYCHFAEENYRSFWNEDIAFRYAKQGADYAIEFMKSNYEPEDRLCKEWMTLVEDTALRYQQGIGVEVNISEAEKYFLIGVGHGDEECKKLLKDLYDSPLNRSTNNSVDEDKEKEYLDMLKESFEDGEISDRERRMLDKIRITLGINEERARELEASLNTASLSNEEQEYLDSYKEASIDGSISEKERKLLEKLRVMYGISIERAKQLENMK